MYVMARGVEVEVSRWRSASIVPNLPRPHKSFHTASIVISGPLPLYDTARLAYRRRLLLYDVDACDASSSSGAGSSGTA
jgi:hypothetical protein